MWLGRRSRNPSMLVLNQQVVGRGLRHFIALATGLPGILYAEVFENFRFFGLTRAPGLQPVLKRHQDGCIMCGPEGRMAGLGDLQAMFVRPRPKGSLSA